MGRGLKVADHVRDEAERVNIKCHVVMCCVYNCVSGLVFRKPNEPGIGYTRKGE